MSIEDRIKQYLDYETEHMMLMRMAQAIHRRRNEHDVALLEKMVIGRALRIAEKQKEIVTQMLVENGWGDY